MEGSNATKRCPGSLKQFPAGPATVVCEYCHRLLSAAKDPSSTKYMRVPAHKPELAKSKPTGGTPGRPNPIKRKLQSMSCMHCRGFGYVTFDPHLPRARPCSYCHGEGKLTLMMADFSSAA